MHIHMKLMKKLVTIAATAAVAFTCSTIPATADDALSASLSSDLPLATAPVAGEQVDHGDYTGPLPGSAAPFTQWGFPTGPEVGQEHDFYTAFAKAAVNYQGQKPAGLNDFSCTSDKNPIVLIPATVMNVYDDYSKLVPALRAQGYCVYGFNHNPGPIPGTAFAGDIRDSARALGLVVDRVLEQTGAEKVTLVGHSQGGGVLPMYYLTKLGGDKKVDQLVGMAPCNHGTTVAGMFNANKFAHDLVGFVVGYSSQQQIVGSDLMREVYGNGPVTRPGIKYTFIASNTDMTVTPYTNSFVYEPGVTNVTVQDYYPSLITDHNNMAYYDEVINLTVKALEGSL